jgi:very-long-chain ceramide synthase
MIGWLFTRQFLFIGVLLSVMNDVPKIIPYKWDPPSGAYITARAINIFSLTLGALLVLMFIWFYMIARVAYGVISGKPAEDVRSDDEEYVS